MLRIRGESSANNCTMFASEDAVDVLDCRTGATRTLKPAWLAGNAQWLVLDRRYVAHAVVSVARAWRLGFCDGTEIAHGYGVVQELPRCVYQS